MGLGIEEPKHDLGWPPLRPLFRDNIFPLEEPVYDILVHLGLLMNIQVIVDLYVYNTIHVV